MRRRWSAPLIGSTARPKAPSFPNPLLPPLLPPRSTDGIGGAAEREFTPPCSNVSRYEVSLPGGGKLPVQVQTFVVPVRPGVCRTFFKVRGSSAVGA